MLNYFSVPSACLLAITCSWNVSESCAVPSGAGCSEMWRSEQVNRRDVATPGSARGYGLCVARTGYIRLLALRGGSTAVEAPKVKAAPTPSLSRGDNTNSRGQSRGGELIPRRRVLMRETVPLSTEDVTQLHEEASREKQQAEKDREVLREVREARLKRELEESGVEVESAGSDDGAGIMVAMKAAGDPESRRDREAQLKGRRLWLEEAEGMMSSCFLALWSLWPIWHALRGMFGLALLFYGQEFATLAFHIVVFRLSGWKKAAKSVDELTGYYQRTRQAMSQAAEDVRKSAAAVSKKNKFKARLEAMMVEKKQLLSMGRVSKEEARAFIDKYRHEIEIIAKEKENLATASTSILAIKGAVNLKKLGASVNSLYAAVVTSITASTFKMAGRLTLALTCGGLIKRTLFDLLGPIIDPIGYQIELETYVAKAMRGPANLYITLVGYLGSAALFFHFLIDAHDALKVTFVLLGSRVVTDYIVWAFNPVRRRFGMRKMDNMPASAVIYIVLACAGYGLHGEAGVIGDYVCRPFIGFLRQLNKLLNLFQMSTISYFS